MARILRIFHKIVVYLQSITSATVNQIVHCSVQPILNNLFMEYCECLIKSDAEHLSFLNSIITALYNFEVEGIVYTEEEQTDIQLE